MSGCVHLDSAKTIGLWAIRALGKLEDDVNKLILAATVLAVGSLAAFDASAQRYEREGPRRGPEPRWEGGHGLPPAGVWRHARHTTTASRKRAA